MTTQYITRGLLKFAEQDDYENGCNPDTTQAIEIDCTFTADSPDKLIKKISAFIGIDGDGIDKQIGKDLDEPGRVDFQGMECDDSTTPTKREMEQWKRGELRLWAVTYTAYIEKIEHVAL